MTLSWAECEQRRRDYEAYAMHVACVEHRARKNRRRAARRAWCRFWLSPWHIAGHPGERHG